MVWEYSLPDSRVYEVLDAPNAKQKTPAQRGLMFANVHPEPPPALSAVCRESRYFVLHHYKPLTLGNTTKYVDLSRDILLLEPYLLIKRLHRTLHFMSQIPLLRENINRLALGTSYGVYTGICHPVLSWRVSKGNMSKLLTALAKFPRLKALVFIVHQEFQFEFDFQTSPALSPPGPVSAHLVPLGSSQQNPVLPRYATAHRPVSPPPPAAAAGPLRPLPNLSPALPALAPMPLLGPPASSYSPAPPPSSSPVPAPLAPRPQLVHQAYRFKFDIEANINHTPRRPHLNQLLYYPLDIDEDSDDWDLNDPAEGSEWCDPWPTNDDWRRFRKRFQRAIQMSVETSPGGGGGSGGGGGGEGREDGRESGPLRGGCFGDERWRSHGGCGWEAPREERPKVQQPLALKGASLLWRYTRGGYV